MDLETIAETLKGFVQNGSSGGLFVLTLGILLIGGIFLALIATAFEVLTNSYQLLAAVTVGAGAIVMVLLAKWVWELFVQRSGK